MVKLSSLLNQRFLKKETSKMAALAEQSSEGQLTSFAGVFGIGKASEKDKESLLQLLQKYAPQEDADVQIDLQALLKITSEVRAIHHQGALLHGERIKKAQEVLKRYRDGAFSAWLLATYGNRQTPYNFMLYYEFFGQMPKPLHAQIESMPRQAIYTLASRQGPQEQKEEIIRNYKGETKDQLLSQIRSAFPLPDHDKRRENTGNFAVHLLQRLLTVCDRSPPHLSTSQKKTALELINRLKRFFEDSSR